MITVTGKLQITPLWSPYAALQVTLNVAERSHLTAAVAIALPVINYLSLASRPTAPSGRHWQALLRVCQCP